MKIADSQQMHAIDKMTIEETGILGIVLMENASSAVFQCCKNFLDTNNKKNTVVVCGGGNNGGDGFAIARMLKNYGSETTIFLLPTEEKIKGDALINYNISKKINIEIITQMDCAEAVFERADLIVDAIFGTGFKGEPREKESYIIEKINLSGKHVISVDIPSGVDSDSGKAALNSVWASETVTFALPKLGNILYPGAEKCGKLTIADISVPRENIEKSGIKINFLTSEMAKKLLPLRKPRSNKGTFGKLFVFAGSEQMPGAGVFCCKAAYKGGCGIVYANMPRQCSVVMQTIVPEAIFKPLASNNGMFGADSLKSVEGLKNATAVIVGPGIGQGEEAMDFVESLLKELKVPALIDADGLNAVAKKKNAVFATLKNGCVITPHPMEMSRLTGLSVEKILSDTVGVARKFAKDYNVVVVLKDARTVIANPDGDVFINTTGNNSMAKAGSGDVLSGVIGGFLAQGIEPFSAAVLGVYIHGKAGDLAANELGHYGVMARDLANFVSLAIKEIE